MGAFGRLPQADNVRDLRGNPSQRRPKPSIKATPAIPAPPPWLGREARAEWRRVTPELHRMKILASVDRAELAVRCDVWDKWNAARKLLGSDLLASGQKGEDRKHPAWQIYQQATTLLDTLNKQLGLTPNARLRMTAPDESKADTSDLD